MVSPLSLGIKLIPSVQVIDLQTRAVTTLVRGMTICDGIRTTPWGTVIATEEDFVSDTGAVYEILDPLTNDEFTILERGSGDAPARIVDRTGRAASDRINQTHGLSRDPLRRLPGARNGRSDCGR